MPGDLVLLNAGEKAPAAESGMLYSSRVAAPADARVAVGAHVGEDLPAAQALLALCGLEDHADAVDPRAALVFNTSNTPADREWVVYGDPLETLWKNCVFGLCGVNRFHREMFGVIVTSSEEQRHAWLGQVRQLVTRFFPGKQDHHAVTGFSKSDQTPPS